MSYRDVGLGVGEWALEQKKKRERQARAGKTKLQKQKCATAGGVYPGSQSLIFRLLWWRIIDSNIILYRISMMMEVALIGTVFF